MCLSSCAILIAVDAPHISHMPSSLHGAPISGTTHLLAETGASVSGKRRQLLDEPESPLQPLCIEVGKHGQQLCRILVDLPDLVLHTTRDRNDPVRSLQNRWIWSYAGPGFIWILADPDKAVGSGPTLHKG